MKLNNSANKFFSVLTYIVFSLFAFSCSLILLRWYNAGDQIVYSKFYEGAEHLSYLEAYLYAKGVIGASDPISIGILWLGAFLGIPKITYISAWNSLFLVFILKLIRDCKVNIFVYPLIFSNYYILVLLTGAERLKFGFLFLLFSVLASRKFIKGVGFSSSLLAHFQILTLAPSVFVYKMWDPLVRIFCYGKLNFRFIMILFFGGLGGAIFFALFSEALLSKFFSYYKNGFVVSNLINIFILFFCSILISRNWKRMALSILPFFFLVMLLGDSRMNIMAVLFVFGVLAKERKLSHPLSILILSYFSYKSFGFMYNVYFYGNGFV